MNSNVMSGQEFVTDLSMMDLEQRIYFMKAIDAYCFENKTDEIDFEKMYEWMSVTSPDQIEAQPLSRQVRRSLANISKKQIKH
jgi:hypothetical protein